MGHTRRFNLFMLGGCSWVLGVFLLLSPLCQAQSTSVEELGTTTAQAMSQGLGVNLSNNFGGYSQEWQYKAIAAMGGTRIRISCGWSQVEKQTPPPNNRAQATQYVQTPACVQALSFAKKYHLLVTTTAAFGPPFHHILNVTTTSAANKGDTSVSVALSSGVGGDSLASLRPFYDYICAAANEGGCTRHISAHHSYEGTLIAGQTVTDATHATLYLASALTAPLGPGSPLAIQEVLYPSTASDTADDPSVKAYSNYVIFLANDMASRGVQGDVELWNEPCWLSDPWDCRFQLYDHQAYNVGPYSASTTYAQNVTTVRNGRAYLSLTSANRGNDPASSSGTWTSAIPSNNYIGVPQSTGNFGFVANLMNRSFPKGVTITWNGTSGSGANSAMGPRMLQYSGVPLIEPSPVVTNETEHPYGELPEQGMVTMRCLQSDVAQRFTNISNCLLPGEYTTQDDGGTSTSNAFQTTYDRLQLQSVNPNYGLSTSISETNMQIFPGYNPRTSYQAGDGASYNGSQYLSKTSSNKGNTPAGSPSNWMSVYAQGANFSAYDPNTTYSAGQGTQERGITYISLISGNKGNEPTASSSDWIISVPSKAIAEQRINQAKFDLRQFLGYVGGNGFKYVEFFAFWLGPESNDPSTLQAFNFVNTTNTSGAALSPLPVYTALSGLMSDVAAIRNPPVGNLQAGDVANIGSYSGSYPLDVVRVVGTRPGATTNSQAMFLWQRSYCNNNNICFTSLKPPSPAPVSVRIPGGMRVTGAVDTITRKAVPTTVSGQLVSLRVSDSPVELLLEAAAAHQ